MHAAWSAPLLQTVKNWFASSNPEEKRHYIQTRLPLSLATALLSAVRHPPKDFLKKQQKHRTDNLRIFFNTIHQELKKPRTWVSKQPSWKRSLPFDDSLIPRPTSAAHHQHKRPHLAAAHDTTSFISFGDYWKTPTHQNSNPP
jgi:hypothetical protein